MDSKKKLTLMAIQFASVMFVVAFLVKKSDIIPFWHSGVLGIVTALFTAAFFRNVIFFVEKVGCLEKQIESWRECYTADLGKMVNVYKLPPGGYQVVTAFSAKGIRWGCIALKAGTEDYYLAVSPYKLKLNSFFVVEDEEKKGAGHKVYTTDDVKYVPEVCVPAMSSAD